MGWTDKANKTHPHSVTSLKKEKKIKKARNKKKGTEQRNFNIPKFYQHNK